MARIDEEQIIVRVSTLVRDNVDVNSSTVVTPTIQNQIEAYAQDLIGSAYLVETRVVTYVAPSP